MMQNASISFVGLLHLNLVNPVRLYVEQHGDL